MEKGGIATIFIISYLRFIGFIPSKKMATEYDKKIAELQVYLPALERRISDARNRKDNVVTGRLEKLRDIVVKKIKVPMEILHKMEEAIRKFIKDVSSSTTSASDLSKNQSSGSKGDLSSKIEVTPVEVKKEPNLHTTIATTDDDDDDDDVKFVESSTSESIIILDDDSSDEEPTKQPNIEIQATQFNLATVKTEVEESCSTLSKEIAKVKDSDEIVERVSSNKKSITLPTAGTSESAAGYNASLNGLEVPQEEELNLKEPCDSNPTRDNNSGPDIVAKVQFDASKVAESRGILQEIESQLKELTTTAQLPLSLDDIDKNDSINEFLSKSSDMSCNKSFKLLENEISPLTTAKQIEVSEANSENNSVLQKLPFPFPSFGNPMLSFVTESPNEAAEKDVASEYVNEAREEIAQSNSGKQISNSFVIPSTKSGTYSEILLPEVINENKVAHEAVPLPMKIDSSALPAIESTTSDVSAIDDDPTNRTTNRLSLPIQIVSSALSTKESTAKDLSAIDGDSTNRTSNQLSLAMQVETSVSSTKESMVEDVSVIDDYPSNRINNRLSLAMVVESSALTAKESTAKDLSAIDGDSKNRTSNQLSLAMQVETSVSSTKKFMVEDVSAIDDDPTSRTSNRLSDIIASLRRNLKHIDSTAPDYSASKEKAKAKEKENKSKLLDVVANKNNLSDLPIVVEDMLASEVASDEETNSLVIEDSSFAMGSNLIDDLGICSINSLETVSDLPNNVMEGDDSLDREINQALAGTSVNQSANDMEGDSFEIAQAAEFHANEINTLKHNDASKVDSNLALELDASNSEKKDESIEVSHSSPVLEIEEQLVHSFNNTPCNHKTSDESMQVDLDSSLSYFATSSLIDNNQASLIIHVTASDDEASEYATTNAQNSNLAEKIAGIVQKEIPIKENDQHETEVFTLETGCLSSSRIESSDIEPTQTKSDSIQPFDKVSGELNVETEESQGTIIFEITTNGYENNQQVFETPDIQKSRPCMIDHPIEISDKSEIVPDSSTISIVDKTTTSPSDEQEASLVLENAQHIRIYVDKHDETRDSDKKIAEPVKSFSSSKAEAAENVTNLDGLKTEQSADKCKPVKRPSSSKAEAAENVTNLEELQTEQSADKCEPVKSPSSSKAETAENATNLDELQSGQSTDKCEPVKSPSSSKAETAKNATNLDELQSGQSTDKCDTVAESITKIQMDAIAANEAKEASEELFLAKLRSTVSIRPITPIHDQEQSSEKSNLKKDKDLECRLRGSKIIASFGKPKTSAGSLNTFKIMQKELSKSDPIDKTESVDLKLSCKKEISSNEEKSHPPTKSPIETEKKEELQEQIVPSTSAKNVKQPQASQESKDINSAIAGNSAKSNLASTPTQPKTLTVKKSSMSIECIETNQKINENISKDTGSTPTTEPEKEKPSERVVAAFSANPGFQDLVKRKRELERKLEELKKQLEQPELVAEAPMTTINAPNLEKALPIDQNLSEISESDKDCVSLSLSEISEPEPGEIIDKRAMPKPYEMPETIKREYPPLDYPKLIPHHMTFISDPSRLENENIKVTIKNEYNPGEDLRAKLIAKAKNEAYMQDQDNIDIRHKKRKKKHKKKKRRVHQEEVSVHHSPVRYVDCQGNIKYCREDLSSDSISDDDLAELMLRRRVLSQHLLDSDSYPQPELDYAQREYDALIQSYKRKTEKLIKAEYMEDNKYELQRDLDRRYGCSFSASDRILPRRVSASPPVLFPLKKRDSLSPLGRRSISPRRFSKSPVKLKRSPRRHSISPMRRRSISPNPFSKSPKRLSRSPLKRRSISPRRLSRSPLRVTRSPNRRSRSPRRLSRSPRRLSRSPRRRPIGISRRLSRSPRRNSRSPRRTRRSPIRPIRSPRRLSRSPKRLGRSPRRTSRSPRRTLRSPRRTLRSPRRSSRSPRRRVSRSPRRTSRPLRRLSRSPRALSPKKERRSPKRVSKSPYRSSKSPKKSTQLATQPLKSLKIENQGTSEAQPPKKPIESATESLDSLKIESQVTSEAQPPKESTQSETLPLHLLKTESQIASEAQPSVSNTPAASENSIDQQQTEVNYPTVIALTDSEDEASANATSGDTEKDSICFTIEVSDEDELVEAPPPPIISADVKKSPKHDEEELISIQKQKADNRQAYENVILIDDDEMNVKNYRESSDVTPFHPKIETTSKSDGSDDGHTMGAMLDDEDLYAPEDDPTTENVETLKEKNLMELQAIKIKLEREMGLSEDILSQLIGSAVDKFNGQPSDTQHYDSMGEDSQYPAMVKLPYQFYDPGNYSRAHVSHKDPRLNRIQPGTVEQVVVKPQLDEAPPPPLIPRLTPAVALPSGSPTSKSSGYKDDYSDDDCLSTGSGSGSEDSNQSGGSKKKKQFVMVEISKLEEIIGQQIAKFLAANKQEEESKKKSPSIAKKTKKDATVLTTASAATETTPPKKTRKNALSKDGSGPRHMTAEKIVSDIRKSMVASLSKSKNPAPEKVERPKSRTRIVKRFETSSESETEKKISPPTKKLSIIKKTTEEPETLRNRITHDLTGIIKLGQTPKSTKGKPAPALKLAEQITDVNLLTPLREIPYEDKRKKKPEAGQSKKQKRAPKNIDISMHCNSGESNCLLCKEMGKEEDLISHYVNVHRENEVYIARLEPHQVAALKQRPNRVKASRKSNIEKFTGKCPFCHEEMTCPIGRFMEHFASHTGEYAYECDCCGTRDSRKRDLLQHCNTECDKGAKFIYVYRYDLSNKTILGYICTECNYTQLNSANVIKHIRTEHEQQHVKSADLITVTLFDVSFGDTSADSGVEEEAVDNIEVNNEAIAEEEEDDYDVYDNFDYMPSPPPPPRAASMPTSGGDEFECVKNEMLTDVIDAIENIDWKPLEETLDDRDELELTKNNGETIVQQPTIFMNDSVHILPKGELDQSYCEQPDIGTQIFTEIHAMASQSLPSITTKEEPANNERAGVHESGGSKGNEDKDTTTPVAKTQPCKDEYLRAILEGTAPTKAVAAPAVSRVESVTSKPVKLKEHNVTITNLARVQSIGIEKVNSTQVKLHCFVQDCDFNPTDSLEELRKHIKAHKHKWSGKCIACGKGNAKKYLSIDRELLHLVNEHLPKKSMAPKLLRPWIANDKSDCYKTKEVCDMLTNQFHLENLYKCMGPDCVFTTNSSTDMQFHITLAHIDDQSALSCCYCNDRFIHANGLVDHIGKVHGASIYQCSKCFYRSVAAYNVQMHQRTYHADNKLLRILQCPGQSHNFSTEILEILDNRQRNVKPLSCPSCHKMVFVKHLLIDHIAKEHPKRDLGDINSALYDCIYCNFGTTDLLSIRQHMANEHPDQLLYVCGMVFIKAQHPLAQQTVDSSSIKTTSLVYIGDSVSDNIFISKDRTNNIISKNSIEWVNNGKDPTDLNEKIRQTFGECVINFSHVETYMRKIDEGMKPDAVKTEETSELEQLVSAAIGDTGFAGKELYRCGYPKCEDACDTFEQFDRHINSHKSNNKEQMYRCPHCCRVIAANQIRMHILQHRRHRYLCFFCGESSSAQNAAIAHLKEAHQSSSVVFVYLTSDKRDWGSHGQVNEQESRIFVAMPRKNNEDATEHMLEVLRKRSGQHSSTDILEPAVVERPLSPIELKEETLVPVFVAPVSRLCCNIDSCPFVAKADEELLQHISDRHLIIMSGLYSCAHCSYTLGSAQMKITRIGNHLQYHGPTIVVCNVCNYYHYNRYRVLNHISICHPYNFVTLTLHSRTPQGSKTKIEILYNKSVRSPEDSYKCTLCEAILTEYEDLFVHMKELHQLNVLFKCDACAFFDSTLQVVEAHAEKVHSNETKRRIRSVFVPVGNKWVQNLSPFELLFEYSISEEEKTLANCVTPTLPVPSVAEKVPPPKSVDTVATEGKKRKLEETESPKPMPETKKSRNSCLKRRTSPSSTEENVKRLKISPSPERAPEDKNTERSSRKERNQSDSACNKLTASDFNASVKLEVDTSKSAKKAGSEMKLAESSINAPEETHLSSNPSEKLNSSENATTPGQKTLPRLKVKPMSKLMPQNVTEPLSVLSPKRAELSTIFSPPTESPALTVANSKPPKRRLTEVYIICFQCGLKGDCFIKLSNHCRTQHPGEAVHFRVAKKLLCAFCYTIASFPEMKAHHFIDHAKDAFITRETANHKKCAECAFEYTEIKELKDHCGMAHSGLHLQMHSSYEFLNQEYLEELLKIGDDVIAKVCRCPHCDHIYLQESHCKNHMTRAHTSLAPDALPNRVPFKRLLYGCNQCNVFFETETRAIQHIRKHIDPYGCNYCEISFPTHSALEDHYRLCHKSSEQSYKFKNISENFKRFMEMLLRFSNGLVLTKYEAEYTDYGRHDEFLQRIENMEKVELRHWISKQTRTQAIDTIARIKIEIEREADMFLPVNSE